MLDDWWEVLEVTQGIRQDRLLAETTLAAGVWRDKIMSMEEARERYVIGGRTLKLFRMLRALWRVKDA